MQINLAKLSTKNLATLASRVIEASSKATYSVVENHPLLQALVTENNAYDGVYTKETYSGKGALVAAADVKRDVPFKGIKSVLSGFASLDGFSGQQAASTLYAIVEKHGLNLDRYSYSEQSAQQKKLIEEFDLPANVALIAGLHLTEPFAIHKAAFLNFENLYAEQTAANADLRQMQSATSIRANLEMALRNYLNIVNAMKVVPDWSALYAELNEIAKAASNSTKTSSKSNETAGPAV
ncbi:MAG: DUF6261 family protein [Bacteroidales bacterium]